MSEEPQSLVSRRSFMRIAGSAAALPVLAASPLAAAPNRPRRVDPASMGPHTPTAPGAIILSSNENPLGPSAAAIGAMAIAAHQGGRYHNESKAQVIAAFNPTFGLKPGYVSLWAGSTPALDLALRWNVGPDKPMVVGSPTYGQGPQAAESMKAPVLRIPLTAHGAHDVRRMAAASRSAGAYYLVNPNNPTGTVTPREDILWLLEHKAPGSVVIVDEAYHHFSNEESVIDQVAADKDLIVTRTFSKIYGMAGLRAGFYIAKPDLQDAIMGLGPAATPAWVGALEVSLATARACIASIEDKGLIPLRRKINADIRDATLEWLDKHGYKYYPGSQTNFFMVHVERPGREFAALMRQQNVYIGRTWPEMPRYVRVTVGTAEEMKKFQEAFVRAYDAKGSTVGLDLRYEAPSEIRYG